ncbi:MAG TPA: polymer-forming cytoskeletal protein [Thermoanaerobaculia bacterium]|nr:polymer-forming cytoskeletal protein [Thermoanaerobaculia bacterium]
MIFKSDGKQSDLNGFLDSGSHLEGELRFEASFRVDGKLTGTVRSEGDLIVGESGEVEGELLVGQVFVSGTVRGTIRASRRVQIAPNGKIFAEIDTPSLIIEDGATFEGRCAMSRDGARHAAGPKLVAQKA